MARLSLALSVLLLASVVFGQEPTEPTTDDLCSQECVAAVYSTYCGGARCIHEASTGRDQFLCQPKCISALGGAAMSNCITSIPSLSDQAGALPARIAAEVKNYCENVVGKEIAPVSPPTTEVESPTTEVESPTVVEPPTTDGPQTVDPPTTVEPLEEVTKPETEPPVAPPVTTPVTPPVTVPEEPPSESPTQDSEEPTEEPETTEPPTEPPTEIPTEPPTEEPIEEPTETPIEPPLEPPVAPPSEDLSPSPEPEVEPVAPASEFGDDFDEMEETIQAAIEDGLL